MIMSWVTTLYIIMYYFFEHVLRQQFLICLKTLALRRRIMVGNIDHTIVDKRNRSEEVIESFKYC